MYCVLKDFKKTKLYPLKEVLWLYNGDLKQKENNYEYTINKLSCYLT